jgi:hypothetical protein
MTTHTMHRQKVAVLGRHWRWQSFLVVRGVEDREVTQTWRQAVHVAVVADTDSSLEGNPKIGHARNLSTGMDPDHRVVMFSPDPFIPSKLMSELLRVIRHVDQIRLLEMMRGWR